MRVPVDDLVRLAGPEDDVLVPIDDAEWEDDVGSMAESLEEGWEPPPLLAEWQRGELLLQDGNHRYEALVRDGATEVWVFVYSDDPRARADFDAGPYGDRLRRDAQADAVGGVSAGPPSGGGPGSSTGGRAGPVVVLALARVGTVVAPQEVEERRVLQLEHDEREHGERGADEQAVEAAEHADGNGRPAGGGGGEADHATRGVVPDHARADEPHAGGHAGDHAPVVAHAGGHH